MPDDEETPVLSGAEMSALCAIDMGMDPRGRGGIVFGLEALGLIAEEKRYVLTEAGREAVDRAFPPTFFGAEDQWTCLNCGAAPRM